MPILKSSLSACAAVALAACVFLLSIASADDRPNVVVILSDDIGYSDIAPYGGEMRTPTLDSLAAGGLRFTQFYNTGRCCPTRASLLTGLYAHQAGVGWMMKDNGVDGYRGDLNRHCVTLAEVLRGAGYGTYMVGKWHVTPPPTRKQFDEQAMPTHNWPLARGFDRFYGTIRGGGSYFDPGTLVRDDKLIPPENPESFYYTDAISDNAAQYIRQHDRAKPFFMYVSYTAAHWPLHAKPGDISKYKGRYDQGWDLLRDERLARMKKLGLLAENIGLAPHVRDWNQEERKEWQAARMEVYAAMIDSMDQGIGRVVQALRETGQYDNTLVLYMQDNGACQEEGKSSQSSVKRDKLEPREPVAADELQFDLVPEFTRAGQPVKWGRGVVPGPADTYMEVGREWANASNTPFRLFKHYVHEGGIATPLIAHWPKGIPRRGEFESAPAHLIDIMPTLVALAGATYPEKFHEEEQEISPLEGVSLLPAFAGESIERKSPLFWEHEGNRAVRDGDWKLVARGAKGKWQLYNLTEDRSELNDLADLHPERVAELNAAWQTWANRAGVLPLTPYYEEPEEEQANKQGANRAKGTRLK
ncbi:MAG: arylsulfatase [Aeoliella sp.]